MKIVIVDDNLSMRKVLGALFESQGHQVVGSLGDGVGLLACVAQSAPDLICLDYNLPGRNGLELLADLHACAPTVDVVMVTGSTDPDLDGRAANAGASGFLRKPFSQEQILEEIKQVGAARRLSAQTSTASPPVLDLRAPESLPKSVVIVDDSGAVRLLLKGILQEAGLTVVDMAVNGEEGVAAAARHRPAVLCLDVEMPRMSGLEALPLIRQVSPETKVVMVTGHPSKSFVDEAIQGGAKGYLLKPVRPALVEAFMKKLLA